MTMLTTSSNAFSETDRTPPETDTRSTAMADMFRADFA